MPLVKSARAASLAAISATGGLALLAYSIINAGVPEVLGGLKNLGGGFVLVLLLSGIRFTARTVAWMLCIEGLPRLPFGEALSAKMIGDALGSLTPLGLFVSEPVKAVLVRRHVRVNNALSAMLIENIVYSVSAVTMIAIGTCVVLVFFPVPEPLRRMGVILLAGAAIITGGGVLVTIRPSLMSGILGRLRDRGLIPRSLHQSLDRMRALEERIFGFATRHPGRLPALLALTLLFHVAAIAEVYVTLASINRAVAPTLLTAFVLEAVNRIVTIAFTFVPLGLGVDEAATGFVSNLLHTGTAAGVTLALVRKARILCWSAVAVPLLVRRGFTTRPDGG